MTNLRSVLQQAAGISVNICLKPLNPSGLVRPPTYSVEGQNFKPIRQRRYIDGEEVDTVLLDSVESQANRLERLLYENLRLPDVRVRFKDSTTISQHEAPGRLFDAIFRESTLNGVPFRQTQLMKEIAKGGEKAEQLLFKHSPLTLLFGGWDAQGEISPEKAVRWPRAVTLEVLGLLPCEAMRTSSRMDPIGAPGEMPLPANMREQLQAGGKKQSLSGAGLGRIPPKASPLDVAVKGAVLVGAISVNAIRQLRLPDGAKEVLLALALMGLALQHRMGYALRSGTDLVPCEGGPLTLKLMPGGEELPVEADSLGKTIEELLESLPEEVRWPTEPLVLDANEDLEEIYKNAQLGKAERAQSGGKKPRGEEAKESPEGEA